jgi:thermitase
MRPHFVATISPEAHPPERPHWSEIMTDKSGAVTALTPSLDALLRRFHLPVWTAREYRPRSGVWSADELASGLDRVYRLILRDARRIPEALIEAIRLLPEITAVRRGEIAVVPLPEPPVAALGLGASDDARSAIRLRQAQVMTRGAPSVVVAVLDTGIELDHPAYADSIEPGFDFVDIIDGADEFIGDYLGADPDPTDEVGHGTHVTGVIAARGGRVPGGVAPECRVMPVRVLAAMSRGGERVGAGLVENINAGIKFAIDHGAHVINMSLGVRRAGGGLPHEEMIDYAARRGVTIVAAAGNDGQEEFYYPGAFPSVIAVGSMSPEGGVSEFSTFGPQVSVIAPGENIHSTYLGRGYGYATGTSHASPFVAGVAALIHSLAATRGGRLGDREVKQIIIETADKLDSRFKDRRAGYGRLNAADALRLAERRIN